MWASRVKEEGLGDVAGCFRVRVESALGIGVALCDYS